MIRTFFILLFLISHTKGQAYSASDLLKREYRGFTLWLDCKTHHGAVAFHYELSKSTRSLGRKKGDFRSDPKVSSACQPGSWRSYRTTTVDLDYGTWDRGQLVSANHMDGNKAALKETFYLTNVLPQSSVFNQSEGAWNQTEAITECYRKISPLKIWGGVIWGDSKQNDFFMVTHGIKTPDFWWKLIYREDKKSYIAWLFPNSTRAKATRIDDFLISIRDLKNRLDFMPNLGSISESETAGVRPLKSWSLGPPMGGKEAVDSKISCQNLSSSPG